MLRKLLLMMFIISSQTLFCQIPGISSGNGTNLDPYHIFNADELAALAEYVNSGNNCSELYFRVENDIDLSTYDSWTPIGTGDPIENFFCGSFDGNNKIIRNMKISNAGNLNGLFGMVRAGGRLANISIENCSVTDLYGGQAAALLGYAFLEGPNSSITITNCHASGTVVSEVGFVGGLISYVALHETATGGEEHTIVISNCSSSVDVTGTNSTFNSGCLVGYSDGYSGKASIIENCFATGSVNDNSAFTLGSLIGFSRYSIIRNCYTRGTVSGNNSAEVGGFIGHDENSSISNCYSTGSVSGDLALGFLGSSSGTVITNSFWDKTTSGKTTTAGGSGIIGLETSSMKSKNTFLDAGWSNSIWFMDEAINNSYPYLAWQNPSDGSPLPVELVSFTANLSDNRVVLKWKTATEINNYGFEIERTPTGLNPDWRKIGFVQGSGYCNSPVEYSFVDSSPAQGNAQYRLKQIDNDGKYKYYSETANITFGITGVEENQRPKEFTLIQNFPNPFNPETTIKYGITETGFVTLKIYDILGNEISTLVNELKQPGYYDVQFNASGLASGIYFYKLQSGLSSHVKKMILNK